MKHQPSPIGLLLYSLFLLLIIIVGIRDTRRRLREQREEDWRGAGRF